LPNATATITALAERWPKAFHTYQVRRVPLKIGIDVDIIATCAITLFELRAAMRSYTGNIGYLLASKEGVARVDLDGNPAGVVTAKEARWAAMRLEGLRQHRAARKAAQAGRPSVVVEAVAAPVGPKRISLADLKRAAQERKKTSTKTEASIEV
jgi:ProP effector